MDIMAFAMVISGTLIVWSSVARSEAMKTRYVFRFLLIPYALIVIVVAIVVQVSTPIVELNAFNASCKAQVEDANFYGSRCEDMQRQLKFWDSSYEVPVVEGEAALNESSDDDLTGVSFILALLYLALVLPLISLVVFFFKRLSVNKLLRRVAIAAGSAIGLSLASAAYAGALG